KVDVDEVHTRGFDLHECFVWFGSWNRQVDESERLRPTHFRDLNCSHSGDIKPQITREHTVQSLVLAPEEQHVYSIPNSNTSRSYRSAMFWFLLLKTCCSSGAMKFAQQDHHSIIRTSMLSRLTPHIRLHTIRAHTCHVPEKTVAM